MLLASDSLTIMLLVSVSTALYVSVGVSQARSKIGNTNTGMDLQFD
jgi:hypothetical protein